MAKSLPQASASTLYGLLDRAGIGASIACAVHCALAPLLVVALPLVGLRFLVDDSTEWAFVGASVALGVLSLVPSYFRSHGRLRPLLVFAAGIGVLLVARILLEEDFWFEIAAVVTAAILIVSAHALNRKLCVSCEQC